MGIEATQAQLTEIASVSRRMKWHIDWSAMYTFGTKDAEGAIVFWSPGRSAVDFETVVPDFTLTQTLQISPATVAIKQIDILRLRNTSETSPMYATSARECEAMPGLEYLREWAKNNKLQGLYLPGEEVAFSRGDAAALLGSLAGWEPGQSSHESFPY